MKKYFEDILNALKDGIPDDWNEIILQVIYGEDSYDIKYYVSAGDIKYVDCFNLGINLKEMRRIFKNLNNAIIPLRTSMEKDSGKWMTMTMIIDRTGHIKTDFGYEDVTSNIVEYRKVWKKKYLN